MIGVMPIKDPPLIPKLDIKHFGRQYRSCSVELMAPRCNDEKEHSRRMFKESFSAVFAQSGPLIPQRKIAPLGQDRIQALKNAAMKGYTNFTDVLATHDQHSDEAVSALDRGHVLRAMSSLPPLVDLAGDANARIRANKRFSLR